MVRSGVPNSICMCVCRMEIFPFGGLSDGGNNSWFTNWKILIYLYEKNDLHLFSFMIQCGYDWVRKTKEN